MTIDGSDVAFRRFTLGDFGTLAERLHKQLQGDTGRALKLLKEAGMTPDQLPVVIREMERRPGYAETRRWVFTTDGAAEALSIASGKPKDEVLKWSPHLELHELALDVIGLGIGGEADGTIPLSEASTPTVTGSTSSPSSGGSTTSIP